MINILSLEFFLGIIFGLLVSLTIKIFFFKKKDSEVNLESYDRNLKELRDIIEKYQKRV